MVPPVPENKQMNHVAASSPNFQLCASIPDSTFDLITNLTAKLLKAPTARICLVDEQAKIFKFCGSINPDKVCCMDSFYPYVIANGEIMVIEDATKDYRFSHSPTITNEPHIRFYAGVPLRAAKGGEAAGILCVMDDCPRPSFSPEDREILRDLGALVMAEIKARQIYASIEPVTGLGNRVRFTNDLEALMTSERSDEKIFVVAIDVSDPIAYNKIARALGYLCTDELVISATNFLRPALPPECTLYHISDFTLAILLKAKTLSSVQDMMEPLIVGLRQPVTCESIPLIPNTHIGIAQFPDDSHNCLELVRAAVTAASDARERNMDSVYYRPKHDQAYRRAFHLLADLPAALAANDQLSLQYQPKVDLRNGACIGVEALLRWRHPTLGIILPGEFIPLAEETTLIKPITEWVLEEALRQLASWHADGLDTKVAINISALNLADPEFPQYIGQRLNHHGLEVDKLELEVTESALMTDFSCAHRQLEAIRQLGINIAIDDFGTGQSAISYLKKIPTNIVKIDQSLIGSLRTDKIDAIIVKSMIELAHNLGFQVVAEGIETIEILNLLEKWSCDIGQGYFISHPLDPDEFVDWNQKKLASHPSTSFP